MKCIWCNGTYEECGCGIGHCAHCNHGEVTDPPYGPKINRGEELDILTDADFDALHIFDPFDVHECVDALSYQLTGRQVLSDEERQKFKDYWDDEYRDDNVGMFLNRVAWLVKQKTAQLV